MDGRRVAITGVTGFLGGHLAVAFLEAGWQVRGVVRRPTAGADLARRGVEIVRADLLEEGRLQEAFDGADVVVANAALYTLERAAWDDFARPNLTGTENVLRAAAGAGVGRVLQISSTAVYRQRVGQVLTESAPELTRADRGRVRHYAVSKALSDQLAVRLARSLDLPLVRLRPCAVYGSGDQVHGPMIERWLQRLPLAVVPEFSLPVVHAGDVAQASVAAATAEAAVGHAYNLADRPRPLSTLLRTWRDVRGWRTPWVVGVPLPLGITYDTSAARADLGFTPRSLEAGIQEAIGAPVGSR